MMLQGLFDKISQWNQSVKRNIVFVHNPAETFGGLTDDEADIAIIETAINRTKRLPFYGDDSSANFDYTVAIEYPFKTTPWMQSRFSDGSYPIWYGSNTVSTTIYETIHHSAKQIMAIEGSHQEKTITKKRSIYDVYCDAILIDLTAKKTQWPALYTDDYTFTNEVGKLICGEGHPGIVSTSIRKSGGKNINIFKKHVLQKPTLLGQLTYIFDLKNNVVTVGGLKWPVKLSL